ncbi:4'-phosphopantetheinyl transferase superfamily protein [Siphonobacter sp. SORGH_AS_0500]|uniref:4'-phosphopantetheinyl transferase family protein n=1 Tax=Siphonobacter sp. SORGH_AS_0500 TaxID=1864824 RepID=UPI002862EBB3|nr:4'-phosphopantetheinyl transferase superfamily protein [Siphonobacter sp. SORGH_AS_0500]MDR6197198.1 phosphopantetheinyl transferase (holo-ACP synthase) [Siphonobacter sp. SORGH_AS_0500]
MIDLVDWAQAKADSHWRRKGFLAKVFSSQEQQLITTAADPDVMVWTLWSMKESAYKLSFIQNPVRRYATTALVCQINSFDAKFMSGEVYYTQQRFYTQSFLRDSYIVTVSSHTTAFQEPIIVPFRKSDYTSQHAAMQQSICSHFYQRFGSSAKMTLSRTPEGIISITSSHGQLLVPCTHHGHFGAFLFIAQR